VSLFHRSSRASAGPEFAETLRAFRVTLGHVEEAKASLVLSVRSGRIQGVPLAAGLSAFEEGLHRAFGSMPPWRRPETDEDWRRCEQALSDALQRARRLRLERSPEIYEELIGEVGALLDPLEAFADAAARFRSLGRG
jgi:hypothetical protein